MPRIFTLHPEHPQPRLVRQAAEMMRDGALVAFPTDSAYALGGHLGDAALLERIRQIRGVDQKHLFTLMCRDLSEIATYARVDNACYRLLKNATPGPFTFILEGTRELPRRVLHPRRKTLGLRVPAHPLVAALLGELGEPVLTSTLMVPGEDEPLTDAQEIAERIGKRIDLIIETEPSPPQATTVVDLTGDVPELVRRGCGDPALLGLED
ncbi:MAG: threonylcarbamoyl-AMP synthase [Rhodocyclaceae bacterium]|nr:threonylcarbamoyl-AMP synthase [Rhodocyclaceae bacterium]